MAPRVPGNPLQAGGPPNTAAVETPTSSDTEDEGMMSPLLHLYRERATKTILSPGEPNSSTGPSPTEKGASTAVHSQTDIH